MYRTIDGSCNNLRHPTWGQSLRLAGRQLQSSCSAGETNINLVSLIILINDKLHLPTNIWPPRVINLAIFYTFSQLAQQHNIYYYQVPYQFTEIAWDYQTHMLFNNRPVSKLQTPFTT